VTKNNEPQAFGGGGYLDLVKVLQVPDPKTKRLGPLILHPAQMQALATLDQRDAEGLRRVRELLLHWFRQSGKTLLDAIIALYGLTADPFHTDRLVVMAASDMEQGERVFEQCRRLASRSRALSGIRFLGKHAVYTTIEREPRTGGEFKSEHRMIVLAGQDIRGAHGMTPSTTILDEVWTQETYDMIEPLTHSPARACPLTVYSSYSGLRSQQHPGIPLFDLIERGKRGDDASFHYSYLGSSDWYSVPWVTPAWIERVRKQLATAPSRFARLIENRVAAGEDAFISDAELADAMVTMPQPERGTPGTVYKAGLDVGLRGAWTALMIGHADSQGRFILDVCEHWQGAPGKSVDLDAVERRIVELHPLFNKFDLSVDPWQAEHLAQRLQRQRVNVVLAAVDAPRVDRLTTMIKGLFVRRLIKFGAHLLPLREQLEAMTVTESKSRGLLRFEGGGKSGAGAHSDLVFSMALACEALEGSIGRMVFPASFNMCYRAASPPKFDIHRCFLFDSGGSYVPPGLSDAACAACPGWLHLRQSYKDFVAAGNPAIGLRAYRKQHMGDNEFVGKVKQSRWESWYL
jgi:hypothetical protein